MRRLLQDRALVLMGAFGFVAGLPLPLSGFTLRQWLSEGGTSLEAIGFTASIGLAYTLKFLWSPFLDHARPPAGLARLGRRRGWLLVIQPLLALACLALAFSDPARGPGLLIAAAVAIAFLSASQDIVVDAWRIETFPRAHSGIGACSVRVGLSDRPPCVGRRSDRVCQRRRLARSLATMAALSAIGIIVTLLAPEPPLRQVAAGCGLLTRLRSAVIEPFREFWQRPGAGHILAFIMLFKLGKRSPTRWRCRSIATWGSTAKSRWRTASPAWLRACWARPRGLALGADRHRACPHPDRLRADGLHGAVFRARRFGRGHADIACQGHVRELCRGDGRCRVLDLLVLALRTRIHGDTVRSLLSSLAAVGLRTIGGLSGILAGQLGWIAFYALTIFAAVPAMLLMLGLLRRFPSARPQVSAEVQG